MKYIFSFFLWIFLTLLWFFAFNQNFLNTQVLDKSSANFSKLVTDKINNLKESIENFSSNNNSQNTDDYWIDSKINKIKNIKSVLDSQYVEAESISWAKMRDAAIQAYVAWIWDPFTTYLTAEDNKSLHDWLKWTSDFEWIWSVVTKDPQWIMLEKIFKDGPAFKAWLKPLDVIVKADDIDLAPLPLWEWIKNIKWPKWTEVKLLILRNWQLQEIKVTRDKVELKSVESKIVDYKWQKFAYISISSIWEKTFEQFKQQSLELLTQNPKWIILDLRWNGWGYLEIWFEIWAWWSKIQDTVVETKYRDSSQNQSLKTFQNWQFYNFPTVVLVDSYTASAGEIIAAAIRDNNPKTKLVGTQTFWKWTIQTLKDFSDWSSLKFTIWKRYTPKWQNLSKWLAPGNWLLPDLKIDFDAEAYKKNLSDNQLEAAKKSLSELIKQ